MKFLKDGTKVMIQTWDPMSEDEITEAFKGNEQTQWWRALVQIIETTRYDYIARASAAVDKNNPLGVARDIGAHEALSQLLVVLEKKVLGD